MPANQHDVAISAREILHLPAKTERVETGIVQFGNDLPGLYIRGDQLEYMAHELKHALATFDAKAPGATGLLQQHAEALQRFFANSVVTHTLPHDAR